MKEEFWKSKLSSLGVHKGVGTWKLSLFLIAGVILLFWLLISLKYCSEILLLINALFIFFFILFDFGIWIGNNFCFLSDNFKLFLLSFSFFNSLLCNVGNEFILSVLFVKFISGISILKNILLVR